MFVVIKTKKELLRILLLTQKLLLDFYIKILYNVSMKSGFIYSDDNKRYHTWNYHLRHKFGAKVMKIALNAGFTCPNIDGTKGYGGCTYCSDLGSGDFAGNVSKSIDAQFDEVCEKMRHKWHEGLYIPYFQAHTNTYAPVSVLKERFEGVLNREGVVGISIATRADCLGDDVLDYLSELNERTYLIVELGLQSVFDKTGELINRCHTYAEFLTGYEALKSRGINTCVHLINGLPNEDKEMMIESARRVGKLRPHCVKLHLLHILKNTVMAGQYERGEIKVLSKDEYVDIIVSQLQYFPRETVIQRLTGDGGRDTLIAPIWSLKKFEVLNAIDKEMEKRGIFQGDKFS